MAHLPIGKRVSFNRLVELYREYKKAYDEASDVFEKAENDGYLNTIHHFCVMRGGYEYYYKVVNEYKEL